MDYRALLIAPLAALVLSAGAADLPLPTGWKKASTGNVPAALKGMPVTPAYEAGIDTALAGAQPSLTVRSTAPQAKLMPNVGQVYQNVAGYGGQRVRLSGELRAERPLDWAGLYLGLSEADALSPVATGRPGVEKALPVGATVPVADGQWHPVSVVLDVPATAPALALGLALVGEGQVWARGLRFEVVGPAVAVTTTPVGIDWAQARRTVEVGKQFMALIPPQPLRNATLD